MLTFVLTTGLANSSFPAKGILFGGPASDQNHVEATTQADVSATTEDFDEKVEHFSRFIEIAVAVLIVLVLLVALGLCISKYLTNDNGGKKTTVISKIVGSAKRSILRRKSSKKSSRTKH